MREFSPSKVILDIGPLGYSYDHKSYARGIHRLTQHLFDGLTASNKVDLNFVATSHLAGAYDLISSRGLSPEKVMRFDPGQLHLSRLGRRASRWVHGHLKVPGIAARARRKVMASLAASASAGEKRIPSRFLDGAQIYHSPLAPIPPSVRNHPGIRHFLTIHDLIAFNLSSYLGASSLVYIKNLLGSLTPESLVFCTSHAVKSDLLTYSSVSPERIFIAPLAADSNVFFPITDFEQITAVRKKYGFSDSNYFLTLSSFDPRKNFEHIIKCFCNLVRSGQAKDCSLVIVGSNPERNRFVDEEISRNPEIRSRIIMPGFIPDEDLAAVYSGALAFLFPSLGEGFGIPVLEAMQCGTPVLSSNTTSLPEVIGNAGILISPTDTDAWCHAMVSISRDATERTILRERGIDRSTFFSWQKFIDATLSAYAFAHNNT